MACIHRHSEFTRRPERRWPHGWWILPALILGAFVWVWIVLRVAETFWGVK
jgi:hypothetical protein